MEWQAYYELEPWGTPAEDDRWRLHYMMQFRGGFQGTEPAWLDRDPEETARLAAEAEAALTLEAKIDAFFSMRAIDNTDPDLSQQAAAS